MVDRDLTQVVYEHQDKGAIEVIRSDIRSIEVVASIALSSVAIHCGPIHLKKSVRVSPFSQSMCSSVTVYLFVIPSLWMSTCFCGYVCLQPSVFPSFYVNVCMSVSHQFCHCSCGSPSSSIGGGGTAFRSVHHPIM